MRRLARFISALDGMRVPVALGGLFVALAAVRMFLIATGSGSFIDAALGGLVIGGLGLVLLYGGYRVPETELDPEVYPRIAGWTLGGFGLMLVILGVLYTILYVSPTGGRIDRPLFAVPLATGLGSVGGLAVGVNEARAISRAREAERRNRELKRAQENLRETVENLESSNDRLEQFAYATSHDLQEPLRMVSSYLQLLEQRYADDLDEDAEEFLEYAIDGADRMRTMIESLLEYSRVNTRGEPLETTDAGAVLDGVLDDLHLRIEETNATVTADELPTVNADPDQLAQVFRNLVSNALTYSGDDPPRVHVGVERSGDVWEFTVADEGIGIDPDYHDQIFEVFNRLHTAGAYSGTGIGLALCERIVERHGGDIWVESEPGEGSTFHFTVPAATDMRDSQPASTSPEAG